MASGGLPGDQVGLVAFDVGEGRPAGLVSLQVAEPLGAQARQALGLGVEGVADDIEVQAVLDGLRLRHLVERDTWPAGAAVAGEQDHVLRSGVSGDLPPEDIGPEPGHSRGVGAVNRDGEQRIAHIGIPFHKRRRLCGRPEGLARTARGLTCRREWQQGSGAVPAGRRGQMAVRPPSAALPRLMMLPLPRAAIFAASTATRKYAARTLAATSRSKVATSRSAVGPNQEKPALLASTSTGPACSARWSS